MSSWAFTTARRWLDHHATADAPDAHGVLDLNGTVVLPPAPGAL
jgi:hypothetical protein